MKPGDLSQVSPNIYTSPMAKVLFFLQLIVTLVVFPLWPGLEPRFLGLGAIFLGLVVGWSALATVAVYGWRSTVQAFADAWSTVPLQPSGHSREVWALAARTFPLAGLLGGTTVLIGGLLAFDPIRPLVHQSLTLAFFSILWGLLGLLLGRILHQVVERLSLPSPAPLLVLTPEVARRFGLTPREIETAQAILDGLTYHGAGEKLGIGAATVKSHVLSTYQKTGTGNKLELLRLVEAENARFHQSVDGRPSSPRRW